MPAALPPLHHDIVFYLSGAGVAGATTVVDQSKNGVPITLTAGAAVSSNRSKFYDTSLYFNGTTGYGVASGVVSALYGGDSYTVAGWFYLNALMPDQNSLFAFHTSAGANRIVVAHNGVYGVSGLLSSYSSGDLAIGVWRHVAMTVVPSTKTLKIWIDGALEATIIWSSTTLDLTSTDTFTFAQEWDGPTSPSDFMQGNIQDLFACIGAHYISPFTPPEKMLGEISGAVLDEYGAGASRRIIAIPRSAPVSGSFETNSDALGNYTFNKIRKGIEYSILVLDNDAGTVRQDLVKRAKSL